MLSIPGERPSLLRYHPEKIGGDKTGNDRWYGEYIPIADRIYDEHIAQLKQEGLI